MCDVYIIISKLRKLCVVFVFLGAAAVAVSTAL